MGDIKRSFEDVNIYELIKLHYRIRNRSKNKFRKLYSACTVLPPDILVVKCCKLLHPPGIV